MPEALTWVQAVPYVNLYMSACYSHRAQPPDFQQLLFNRTELLNRKNAILVMLGVEAGNVDDIFDMAMR